MYRQSYRDPQWDNASTRRADAGGQTHGMLTETKRECPGVSRGLGEGCTKLMQGACMDAWMHSTNQEGRGGGLRGRRSGSLICVANFDESCPRSAKFTCCAHQGHGQKSFFTAALYNTKNQRHPARQDLQIFADRLGGILWAVIQFHSSKNGFTIQTSWASLEVWTRESDIARVGNS